MRLEWEQLEARPSRSWSMVERSLPKMSEVAWSISAFYLALSGVCDVEIQGLRSDE